MLTQSRQQICYGEPLPITGKITRGRAGVALDAMPDFRPDAPAKAAAVGARREQMDQGDNGAISREHASQLHDLAFKAGVPEADHQAFARVLALLAGGGDDPAGSATDRKGGRLSRDTASKIWTLAKDKLSPQDLATLTEKLKACLADEGEAQDADHPPAFSGQPLRPGMAGDAARRAFLRDHPYMANVGHAPPYGEQMAPRDRRQAALALDAARRASASGGAETESNPDLRAALASMAKIGRCY
jgi:hypothetical protein